MGLVGVFVGYGVYRLVAGDSDIRSKRRMVAGAVAGYVSLNVSALIAAIEFGIQPILEKSSNGQPLFSPFPLTVTIPAMLGGHLLFGIVEALVTALVIKYFQKNNPEMLMNS